MSLEFLLAESDPASKREIMRCALSLFVRDGLAGTSIREIARAGGYTNPALYKFFPTKDALALHLFDRCYAHVLSRIEASQSAAAPFRARLQALVRAYAALVDEDLEAVLYVDETLRTLWPRLPAPRKRSLLAVLRGLVEAGRQEGAISTETDVELAVALLVGTLSQVARMAYFDELPRSLGARAERLLRLFESALAPGRSRQPRPRSP